MEVLIVGNQTNFEAFRQKFLLPESSNPSSDSHTLHFVSPGDLNEASLKGVEVVFDFTIEENFENLDLYQNKQDLTAFVNDPKTTLAEMAYYQGEISCTLAGFNGLPSLFNRPVLEVTLLKEEDADKVKGVLEVLKTDYCIVEDRVGMVTPRVLCMIINEAFYTLMEKTATVEDINLAMKLGTSYPYGPFEFAERIGIKYVYEILEAVYEDTKDERYKICPLLKKKYLGLR